MELFRIRKDIPFMRHRHVFNVISLVVFLLSVYFLIAKGLNLSIEFTGGTLVEVRYQEPADLEKIRHAMQATGGFKEAHVQNFGSPRDVMIRVPLAEDGDSKRQGEQVMAALANDVPGAALQRVEFVGPQVGSELVEKGLTALLLVIVGIIIYLSMRFEWRFSLAAIIANLHDVVIILGFFAFFGWEFSLSVLAAVLAVLGYSVNEAVVVFDRVRETFRSRRDLHDTEAVINHAITATMSRTIITHGSTQLMVLSMLIFGGETLYYFSLALTIGILFGIYSSVLVGSPLAMMFGVSREHFIKAPPSKDGVEEGELLEAELYNR